MKQMRIALFEVHRVLDSERVEAVELLDPRGAPLVIQDRSLAKTAVRFASHLSWAYPLPHYWRLSGSAVMLPDMGLFEPAEIVREIARHLGGPTEEPDLRRWLAEHFARFDEALSLARRSDMFASIDAQWGKAVYEWERPWTESRDALDACPAVVEDPLVDEERKEGFVEGRVWFAQEEGSVKLVPGTTQLLGRLLLSPSNCRLEAVGAGLLATLRQRFEACLGDRVRFVSEVRDDLISRLKPRDEAFDPSLVPPRLRERGPKFVLTTSRAPVPLSAKTRQECEAEFRHGANRAFLDEPVPALEGQTPRAAAFNPALRPTLIQLLKARVRQQDEENLRTGRSDDINWLLRELGAHEILFDPPREPVDQGREDEAEFADETDRPPPPPLPERPLTLQEAQQRLDDAIADFDTAQEALDELEACGSTLVEDLAELTDELLTDKEFSFLVPFVVQLAFALAPPGTRQPPLDLQRLELGVRRELQSTCARLEIGARQSLESFFGDSPQPFLVQVCSVGLFSAAEEARGRVRPEAQLVMVLILKALAREMHQALSSQS
jgi:hypothetical protein